MMRNTLKVGEMCRCACVVGSALKSGGVYKGFLEAADAMTRARGKSSRRIGVRRSGDSRERMQKHHTRSRLAVARIRDQVWSMHARHDEHRRWPPSVVVNLGKSAYIMLSERSHAVSWDSLSGRWFGQNLLAADSAVRIEIAVTRAKCHGWCKI